MILGVLKDISNKLDVLHQDNIKLMKLFSKQPIPDMEKLETVRYIPIPPIKVVDVSCDWVSYFYQLIHD